MNATIVIPVFNQLHYTRQCLDSLKASGYPDSMIVVINNASTDGTLQYLADRPGLKVINNPENRACAAAWNQGFRAGNAKWTVFLNNDVVLPPRWLENLVAFAEKANVDIACPAIGEGDLDYDLTAYARDYMSQMSAVQRKNKAHGVCFMVQRKVMETVGNFDENFRKGGNEDEDFFIRARQAGFRLAVTGNSYLHHFGSVTQKALAADRGSTRDETVGYFRSKWKITWFRRRQMQWQRKLAGTWCRWTERLRHGHTLCEWHGNGKTYHR